MKPRSIIQIAAVGFKRADGDGEENTLYALADDGSVWSINPDAGWRGPDAWKALPLLPQTVAPNVWRVPPASKACGACGGTGDGVFVKGEGTVQCAECNGTGKERAAV